MPVREIELVILIADLCGYTALTEAHGNVHAAQAIARYAQIALATLEPGARLVERVGDEVLIAAEQAAPAVRTALALRAAIEHEPLFPTLRCGLHAGTVAEDSGNYFGSALNLTARVAGYARGGQILCTAPITLLASGLPGVEYQPLGSVRFKNIVELTSVFEVAVAGHSRERSVVDPVCRMHVDAETAPARLPFGATTYYFCSFECAKTFVERPGEYASAPASR